MTCREATFFLVLSLASCKRSAPVGTGTAIAPLTSATSMAAPAAVASIPGHSEARLRMLLEGAARADELSLEHTDPGVPYAPGQYLELTTVVDDSRAPTSPEVIATAVVDVARPIGGTFDDENLQRVTRGMRAGFRNCYRRALLTEPGLSGKVALDFTVEPSGAVRAVTVASAPSKSYELKACVRARGLAAVFNPLDAGDAARFRLDVTFTSDAKASR